MVPPEETLTDPVKESQLVSEMVMIVAAPKESATKKTPWELAKGWKCPNSPDGRRCYHPSWPVAVAGQPPCPSRSLEQTYPLEATCNWSTKEAPTKTLSYTGIRGCSSMEAYSQFHGYDHLFEKPSSEEVPKMPPIPVVMGMMAAPGIETMSTSQVVQDEATGATYLDTVTTSIGRVHLVSLRMKS